MSEFERYLKYMTTQRAPQLVRHGSVGSGETPIARELLALRPRKGSAAVKSLDHQTLLNYVELLTKNKAELRDSF